MTKEQSTIFTVNLYKDNEIMETYEYTSLVDATNHMQRVEEAPHLYPGITTELLDS